MGELVFIGLGLRDEGDLSLRGLEVARACDVLFAEQYTSRLAPGTTERLAARVRRPIRVLGRAEVEEGSILLEAARTQRVALLVPGDPMTATTHLALRLRAAEAGVSTRIVHGASIATAAAGLLGLQLYKFGRTATVPFPAEGYRPATPYEVLAANGREGLHTLLLLDLREGGEAMTAADALAYLRGWEEDRQEGVLPPDRLVAAVAAAGSEDPGVRADRADRLARAVLGPTPHVLVAPGRLHFLEAEALIRFAGAPPELVGETP